MPNLAKNNLDIWSSSKVEFTQARKQQILVAAAGNGNLRI